MTSNFLLLSYLSYPPSPSFVTIVNSSKSPIHGIGTINIFAFTLSSVLYIPNFTFNLLYLRKLISHLNFLVRFYPLHCIFQDLNIKRTFGRGFKKDAFYYFQLPHKSSVLHTSDTIVSVFLCLSPSINSLLYLPLLY